MGRKRQKKIHILFNRQSGLCAYCGAQTSLTNNFNAINHATKDHVVPRSAGGSSDMHNVKMAGRQCNQSKGSMPAGVFRLLVEMGAVKTCKSEMERMKISPQAKLSQASNEVST